MFDLLEDWRSNNENMKTIAPNLLQSVDFVNNATKEQIEETDKINNEVKKRSNELNDELTAVSSCITEHTEENQNGISKIIESVNNHTKLFAGKLESSKSKIFEQFEQQKNVAIEKFKNIECNVVEGITNVISSAADIVSDIKSEDAYQKEDLQNNLKFNTSLKTIVKRFNVSSKAKLNDWRNSLINFHKNELKMYTPSG